MGWLLSGPLGDGRANLIRMCLWPFHTLAFRTWIHLVLVDGDGSMLRCCCQIFMNYLSYLLQIIYENLEFICQEFV